LAALSASSQRAGFDVRGEAAVRIPTAREIRIKSMQSELSEADLEAELLKLSRSNLSGTKVQARVAAIRTLLRRRQREREAAERAERESRRKEERQREQQTRADDDQLLEEVRRSWFEVDLLPNMCTVLGVSFLAAGRRLPPERWRQLESEAQAILASSDPCAAFDEWRDRQAPIRPSG